MQRAERGWVRREQAVAGRAHVCSPLWKEGSYRSPPFMGPRSPVFALAPGSGNWTIIVGFQQAWEEDIPVGESAQGGGAVGEGAPGRGWRRGTRTDCEGQAGWRVSAGPGFELSPNSAGLQETKPHRIPGYWAPHLHPSLSFLGDPGGGGARRRDSPRGWGWGGAYMARNSAEWSILGAQGSPKGPGPHKDPQRG